MAAKSSGKRSYKSAMERRPRKNMGKKSLRTFGKLDKSFQVKLKHVLGGVSLLSLLAAFEVFSIPAANGIIDLFGFSTGMAGWTWTGVAMISGGFAIVLHREEENDKYGNGLR